MARAARQKRLTALKTAVDLAVSRRLGDESLSDPPSASAPAKRAGTAGKGKN